MYPAAADAASRRASPSPPRGRSRRVVAPKSGETTFRPCDRARGGERPAPRPPQAGGGAHTGVAGPVPPLGGASQAGTVPAGFDLAGHVLAPSSAAAFAPGLPLAVSVPWSPSHFAASCGGVPLRVIRRSIERQRGTGQPGPERPVLRPTPSGHDGRHGCPPDQARRRVAARGRPELAAEACAGRAAQRQTHSRKPLGRPSRLARPGGRDAG